ncbi:MAG: DUF262 domain-containing protein [Gemmatimonadota bacterium]
MDADTLELRKIFRKDTRYEVPIFQRPYVWNEDDHWQLLWDDILEVVEEVLERRRRGDENGQSLRPHFLGAMVLEQIPTPTRKLDQRQIIDGQQRLITLQMLLAAGRTVAQELKIEKQVYYFDRLLYNDDEVIENPEFKVKLWPIEPDRNAFLKVVAPELLDGSQRPDDGHRVLAAYKFFEAQIKEWVTEEGENEHAATQRLDALTTTLWDHLRIVVIDLDKEEDDSQMIFETLNARGTPLLHADLIKNHSFREAESQGLDVGRLHSRLWAPFDEEEWRETVSQGRVNRPKVDVLITHWLTMRTKREIRLRRLFQEYQKHMDGEDRDVEGVLRSLSHHGEIYSNLMEGEGRGRAPLFFRRLDVMDTTTAVPVLLWMLGEDVPLGAMDTALHAIESWLVRRMLTRESTRAYNRVFLDMLKALDSASPAQAGQVVVQFLRTRESANDYWPDDHKLTMHMTSTPYWSRINQRRLRMVFRALEEELRGSGFSEEKELTGSLHIEHILPREWAHHWPLPGERPAEVERLARDEAKDLIGNLTILTDRLNPKVSNRSWSEKREAISDFSTLRLNRELVTRYPERWDEAAIRERGERLAELTSRVWPPPASADWKG